MNFRARTVGIAVCGALMLILPMIDHAFAQFRFRGCDGCSTGCPSACNLRRERPIWRDDSAAHAERERRERERAQQERRDREERDYQRQSENSLRDAAEQRRHLATEIIPSIPPASIVGGPMARPRPSTKLFNLPGGAMLDEEARVPTVVTPPSLSAAETLHRAVAIVKAAEN